MKKTIIILAVLIILLTGGAVFITKYGQKQNNSMTAAGNKAEAALEKNSAGASVSVGHIDFKAVIVTEQNFNELNTEFDGKLDKSALNSSTQIALMMNNHRDDLSAFNYGELAALDGTAAQNWRQLGKRMGGHHINGVLTFPKTKNPRSLTIKGLPVGDVALTF